MPAVVSSPIPAVLDQLCDQPDVAEGELPGLLARLAEVPDPRKPRDVRHSPVYALALAACAVLTGATSLLAISEWAANAPPAVLDRLGARRCPLTDEPSVACRPYAAKVECVAVPVVVTVELRRVPRAV